MTIEWLQIETALYQLIWPLIRVSSVIFSMSVLGANMVPHRIKVLLSLAITLLITPQIPVIGPMEVFSGQGFITIFSEVGIGVAMGFATRILFETFVIGGQMVAMQTGLGFASLVDPNNGVQVPLLGQFFLMLTTLIFLAVDGHLLILKILVQSFTTFPVGESGPTQQGLWSLLLFGRWMFAGAVLMALSAALALLTVNLTFGIMTKAAPQLNIFAIGFPISMVSGLLIIWLTLGGFGEHFNQQMSRTTKVVCDLVRLDC